MAGLAVLAVRLTPNGVPVVGVVVSFALVGWLALDVARYPEVPWPKWLQPAGVAVVSAGIMVGAGTVFAVVFAVAGATLTAIGFGVTRYWRENR